MKSNRREFLKTSLQGAAFCCAAAHSACLFGEDAPAQTELELYAEKLSGDRTYCTYTCNKDCPWLKASFEKDEAKLKELAEGWSEKHDGKKLDEETLFCFGCKPVDGKPLGSLVKACDVRPCAIEKGFQSCEECKDLAGCDKSLWTLYPKFREMILERQKANG